MGTKNEPGEFDCYAKADPDEPIFVLRAKDKLAPHLVRLWQAAYLADPFSILEAAAALGRAMECAPGLSDKADEAATCATDMENWRAENILDEYFF